MGYPLSTAYQQVRNAMNKTRIGEGYLEPFSFIRKLKVNPYNGSTCNGSNRYAGCHICPLPEGYYYCIDGTGLYWCEKCAEKHGLKKGMKKQPHTHYSEAIFSMQEDTDRLKKPCPTIETLEIKNIRTQKAAGLAVISGITGWTTPPTYLIQSDEDMAELSGILSCMKELVGTDVWARPCPTRPRHGFLESRAVKTAEEVKELWHKTKQIEPDAELMLQPMVDAHVSAILTPNKLVWGTGNDGATSGRNAKALKLGSTKQPFPEEGYLKTARLSSTDAPYIELVWSKDSENPIFVQLRGGPKVAAVNDYVPRKRKVKHIYVLDSDAEHITEEALLIWEKAAKEFKPGTVVYHKGGDVASHYGVHCVANKVPYFTTRCPEIGETIHPESLEEDFDAPALIKGIQKAHNIPSKFRTNSDTFERVTLFSMFTLHNCVADRGELASEMLGFSANALFRIMAMACLGELRHFGGTHGGKAATILDEDKELAYLLQGADMSDNRQEVFVRMWKVPTAQLASNLAVGCRSFLRDKWSGGIGGLRWGKCALYALHLYEAFSRVEAYPTKRNIRHLLNRMNATVNLVHNGGSLFNKFTRPESLNRACKLSRNILLHNVFPLILMLETTPTMKVTRQTWKCSVPRDLRRYALDTKAVKRAYAADGKLDSVIALRGAVNVMSTIRNVYASTMLDMCVALQYAFAPNINTPPSQKCSCGKLRAIHAKGESKDVCSADCDSAARLHNRSVYIRTQYSKRLDQRFQCARNPDYIPPNGSAPKRVADFQFVAKSVEGVPEIKWVKRGTDEVIEILENKEG